MFTCNYSHARDNLASLLELAVDEIQTTFSLAD